MAVDGAQFPQSRAEELNAPPFPLGHQEHLLNDPYLWEHMGLKTLQMFLSLSIRDLGGQ